MLRIHHTALALASAAALMATAANPVRAQMQPAPQGVVSLQASATTEVDNDTLWVVFSTTRDGSDPVVIQNGLKQALDAALTEARKVARPGQIELQAGALSLSPRYVPKGGISGWQGTVELRVHGRDLAGIGALVGRINGMTVSRMGYDLSREAREKAEALITVQAVERYRAQAAEAARLFGYKGYVIREVNLSTGGMEPRMRMLAAAPPAGVAMASEAMPIESGKGSVTVTVSGSVQLN